MLGSARALAFSCQICRIAAMVSGIGVRVGGFGTEEPSSFQIRVLLLTVSF